MKIVQFFGMTVSAFLMSSVSSVAADSGQCGGKAFFGNSNSCPGGGTFYYSVCRGQNGQYGVSNFGVQNNQPQTIS
ncbi:hypothetical protein, partial [Methylobacterium sp. SD274]|uniref:hypothetical protein n=1 Tax=Methylobacterium sp. SD274 TaxID=2782009 RepID=UPI001A97B161